MEKVNVKYMQLLQALHTLEKIIHNFRLLEQSKKALIAGESYEDLYIIHRDSLIQRFEYCTDLFWKYLKKYLESVNVSPVTQTPRDTIILATDMNLLSRDEAEKILRMIKSRNMTSPIYVEEIADQISKLIPDYYLLLIKIAKRLNSCESGH